MANEFRVKEGLIVDGVTGSGVNPVQISDAVISSASALEVRSTANADPSILIHSNGGDDETIKIRSNQGTGADSIILVSDEGGITLDAELDIALDANGGDVFVKDNGTVYGSLTNSSGALHIYSGTSAVLKLGTNSVVSNASFMGDLTVGGTAQTGSAANRLQVNSPSGSAETVEARIRTSIETPSTIAGVSNVLVLDNGNKASVAAQGMVTTIGSSAATDGNTQAWFWGRMDTYNVYSLGYTSGKHWDTSSFAGSATSPEKAAQSLFQVDSTGRILVGANNAGNAGTAGPQNMVTVHIDDDDGQDGMIFIRQDSSTASGDLLGAIGFDSTDGNVPSLATEASAYIAAYATEAHAAGNKGGALVFGVTHLTDNDDTTSQEVMRISSDSATSAFVQISNVDDSGGELRFMEDTDDNTSSATQYAAFKAQAMAASYTMILPAAQGTAGQVLDIASVNSTEITLAWDDVATGGGGDVTAGSSFNTAGVLMASNGSSAKQIDVPGATLTTNGQGLTVGGATIVQPGSSVGAAALTLTATDVDQIALDINASNTTADVLDIAADAVTTAKVIDVTADALTTGKFFRFTSSSVTLGDGESSILMDTSMTNDSTAAQTAFGMVIDYNKSGITATGKTADITGFGVDLDDSATNHGSSTVNLFAGIFTADSANSQGTTKNVGIHASASGASSNYAGIFEAGNVGIGTTTPDHTLEIASSSANEPVLAITNTHSGTTSGELRFNKDTSSGDDNDVMGMISFYGTDAGEATHERLAYMDAVVTDSAAGSEAASIRFFVAENDATLTQGLVIAGQADNDGEVDVTIGAGSGSTATVAGDLNITGDLTVTGTTTTVHVETTTTSSGIIFEGTTGDGHDGTLTSSVAGGDVTYTLPNLGGHVALFAVAPAATITSTPAELNLLDTAVANTVVNSKAVIYGSSGELAGTLSTAAQTNVTSLGTLSALTVDDVAINGKVITMTGDTDDTVVMTAAANGEFTIATTDNAAAAGHMNLDADGKIVLNTADDEHVVFEQAGVDYLAIGQGTVAIADIEDSAGATVVDTWDATVYTAVKYLLVVENVTDSTQRMAVEMFVMGDDQPSNSAAYSTTYAVLFDAEIGTFSAAGRSTSNLIDLKYTPTATGGTVNHRVRVVAQRVASLT